MLKSFPGIKLFLSTGTAVATPCYKEHLNLGDVVSAGIDGIPMIPETLKNVPWDLSMTGMKVLNSPPKICLTSIWDVYIDLASEENTVQLAMDNALSPKPGLRKKFGRPQHGLDGSRGLPDLLQALEEDMNGEALNRPSPVLPRQAGASDDEKSIYYGKIASGVSTSRTAATLAECLCFTAEAEDISVDVPCL